MLFYFFSVESEMEHGLIPSLTPGACPTQNHTEDNDGLIKIKQAVFQEAEGKTKKVSPGSGIRCSESLQGNSHSQGFRAGRHRVGWDVEEVSAAETKKTDTSHREPSQPETAAREGKRSHHQA